MMQTCCAAVLTKPILRFGLEWLESIKQTEAKKTFARNPHELARVLECETRITVSDLIMRSCIAKLELEEAGTDPKLYVFNKLENNEFKTSLEEDKYWLRPPYAASYLENYQLRRNRERKGE